MNDRHMQNQSSVTTFSFTIKHHEASLRLDQALSIYVPDVSRERARKFIQLGSVWINGKRVQILSRKVFTGDAIALYVGREGYKKYYEIDPGNILYQDEHLLFYRKEPHIPTQAIICDNYNNLYAALQRYLKAAKKFRYLGLHHRLDLETSGVILFTLSPAINRSIHYQFKNHEVKKSYLALVVGSPTFTAQTLTSYISRAGGKYRCSERGPGKIAICHFITLMEWEGITLVRAEPKTGRTHQIRLQLAFLGHPLLGDPLYGDVPAEQVYRTMLHAESLSIIHPVYKKELTITADLFEDMRQLIMTDGSALRSV